MKRTIVATLAFLLCSATALAADYTYDYQTGSGYTIYGNGRVQGFNSNTGSTWSSQSYGGTTFGTDSTGNSWTYNRDTGNYYNFGTGEQRNHGRR